MGGPFADKVFEYVHSMDGTPVFIGGSDEYGVPITLSALKENVSPQEIIDRYGGDVLKFGGDALLVLFSGPEHTARAAVACFEMRVLIERRWSTALTARFSTAKPAATMRP